MQEERISILLQNIKDNDLESFKENLKVENINEILKNEVDNFTYEIIKADSEGKQGREFITAMKKVGITWEIVKDVEDITDWKYIEGKNGEKNYYDYRIKTDLDKKNERFIEENREDVNKSVKNNDYKALKDIANKELDIEDEHPLLYTIENITYNTFRMIVKAMSAEEINIYDHVNRPLLKIIIDTKRIDFVQPYIEKMGINYESDGKTALMYAVEDDQNAEIVDYLIREGADTNHVNGQGENALFYSGNAPTNTKYLLDNGLRNNIDHINKYGKTALFYAVKQNNPDTVKLLIDSGANVNISTIGFVNNDKIIKFDPANKEELIKKGADVNIGSGGKTPLFAAIENNALDAFKVLLENGADINHCNINGLTPLMYACMYVAHSSNAGKMIEILLDKGADVKQYSEFDKHENWNALTFALNEVTELFPKEKIKDIVESLVTHGVEVNELNEDLLKTMFGTEMIDKAIATSQGIEQQERDNPSVEVPDEAEALSHTVDQELNDPNVEMSGETEVPKGIFATLMEYIY